MDNSELIDKITREVVKRLKNAEQSGQRGRPDAGPPEKPGDSTWKGPSPAELASYVDHTLLRPEATVEQVDRLCAEAVEYRFYSVCVNGTWAERCARKLRGTGVKLAVVVGFPLGAMTPKGKAVEARHAVEAGAHEIDMVVNVGALKSGRLKEVEEDIRAVKRALRQRTVLKVILETGLLSDDEKVLGCRLAVKAGADFVKTSTGFSKGGATVEDVMLMRRTVGPSIGVKASGGIRSRDEAIAMIRAGATRLGTSSSVSIVTGVASGDGRY